MTSFNFSLVAKVTASGPAGIFYDVTSGDSDHFRLDWFTGRVTLLLPLDYEARRDYVINVEARGGDIMMTSSMQLNIHVTDVNDNRFLF